jgi:benzylsuccinate CoA-transferase BbsF subunit
MAGPLGELKVWDASWIGVGPLAARYLGDYGATVVHTESTTKLDTLRGQAPFKAGIPGLNRSQFFADYNASKLGLGVNLTSPGGREVAERLAGWADVVLESMRPGTFARLGYSYERLARINPAIIVLSTSMLGQTGPRTDFAGFGTALAAASGFCEITGWPDRMPGSPYGAYTDFIAQRFAAIAIMGALEHRRRTGQGQYIDLAQIESCLQLLGTEFLDLALNGRVVRRNGNRSDSAAPHGVFACLPEHGRERYVAIAVESQDQWAHLANVIGQPGWARDPRYATLARRKEQEDALETALAAWTSRRTASEVVQALQPHVPAGWVHDAFGLQQDAQIAHRGYFVPLQHTEMGECLYEGAQALMSLTPHAPSKAAPCLGEDTRQVLTGCLGYSDAEVDKLLADGDVETVIG